MDVVIDVPAGLDRQRRLGPDWVAWLDGLAATTRSVMSDWNLEIDGASMHGYCSLVLPVLTTTGDRAVLKVAMPDDESEHEALALQRWGGAGAVRLLRADPHRRALLLERLGTTNLNVIDDVSACEVVAGLYGQLHVPALPQLRTVTSYIERWAAALATLPASAPIPHRVVQHAVSLAGDLVTDPASIGRLVHGDLHGENVVAGDRQPWLVIDPKAMSGDPHYEPAPMLWNRWAEVVASGNVRDAVRRRFHTIVDAAELDKDRARDWVIVRMVINANWTIEDGVRTDRALTRDEQGWITICLSIAKAVQE